MLPLHKKAILDIVEHRMGNTVGTYRAKKLRIGDLVTYARQLDVLFDFLAFRSCVND